MSRPQGRPALGRTPRLRSGPGSTYPVGRGTRAPGTRDSLCLQDTGPLLRVHQVLGGRWGPPSRGPRGWGRRVVAEAPAWMSGCLGCSLLRTQGGLFSGAVGRELRAGLGLEAVQGAAAGPCRKLAEGRAG